MAAPNIIQAIVTAISNLLSGLHPSTATAKTVAPAPSTPTTPATPTNNTIAPPPSVANKTVSNQRTIPAQQLQVLPAVKGGGQTLIAGFASAGGFGGGAPAPAGNSSIVNLLSNITPGGAPLSVASPGTTTALPGTPTNTFGVF